MNIRPSGGMIDNNKQMIINFKGMDNVVVQGDDKSRMHNILQNNRMGRGNQGRNIQTLPAA